MSERAQSPAGTAEALERRLAGLSPEKRALLEQRLLARSQPADAVPEITPRQADGPAPLSFVQELMWLIHELHPGTYTYNSSGARRLHGALDADALERAINRVIERHSALRTSFELRDGAPVQIINEGLRLTIERVSAPGIEGDELVDLMRTLVRRAFDLTKPLLMRATLVEIAADDHVLVTSADHIVWDGWSKGIFFRELADCYDAFCTGREPVLPELRLQYADFAVWQRAWLAEERMERQLDYWRQTLSGAPPLLDLPTDRPRPAVATHRGDRMEHWIAAETLSSLRNLARLHGATEFMLLVAAWATLLRRLSGQDDIVLGTPIAGRNRVEVEGIIGYFNNTLALRIDCSSDPSFVELLGRVRERLLSAYSHQDVSFEHVVREVAPQRDASYSPIFQSLIVLQNAAKESSLKLRGLEMEMIVTESGTAKFDLSLGMGEYDGKLHASMEYNSDLFDRETVDGICSQFARLLDAIVEDPGRRLSELPLLSDAQLEDVVAAARGPVREIPPITLHGCFRERAAAAPDAVAIDAGDGDMSYGELEARTGALARALGERGIGRGGRVGFCVDRSPGLLVAMLGILRSGAAVVPLDPEYPDTRLAQMVQDAGLELVIADGAHGELVERLGATSLDITEFVATDVADLGELGHHDHGESEDAAFVIFTSGSTGRPKGVILGHRGLINHALSSIDIYGVTAAERTLQFASVSFDISLEEIFTTLLAGGTLVLRDEDMPLGGAGLVGWLEHHRVSFMDLPTAFWHEWVSDLDRRGGAPPRTLRRLVVGGEKVSVDAWETWRRIAPSVRWFNTYGPTEASVIATAFEPPADWARATGAEIPIGTPLPNVAVHILDERGRPVPTGVRGELHIGGAGVAHGYLRQPDATASSFPTLAWSGERVYRTGDVVRRGRDGLVEFVGRTDQQIKLRGFRIEPAEVEAALVEAPGVTAALAVVLGGDEPRLVAYVLGDGETMPDPAAIRRTAANRLPAFAVPSAVVVLDAFPLTPNGKVDRDALPAPEAKHGTAEHAQPHNHTERVFAEIWSELLGTEVGIDDDFFELGGHSMLAVRMLTQVEERLGFRLRLASMVRTPTIRGLAEGIVPGGDASEVEWPALVEMKPEGTRRPLFLMHSLTGDVLIYRDLVRRLAPEQPAWGLEALGGDGRQLPKLSIPDMASHYIAEVQTVQPHGPYYLAGLCYGGDVAHEMAHQLEAAGERVAFVGLIDANPLGLRPNVTTRMRIGAHMAELRALPAAERADFLHASGRNVVDRIRRLALWRAKKALYIDRGRALPPSLADMMELNFAAAAGYVSPMYGGRVTLFRVHNPEEGAGPDDLRLRWEGFAAGGLEIRDIVSQGAGHISVLFEPHVAALAVELEAALQAAQEP